MVTDKRWIAAIAVVLAMALGTVAVLAAVGDGFDGSAPGGDRSEIARAEASLPQARWKVTTFAAWAGRPRTRADREAVVKQRGALARAVTTVIDTLVLAPDSLRGLSGGPLSPNAAKAFGRSRLPLPKKAEDVQTVLRRAQIGLDTRGRRRAAAKVIVRMKAEVEGKRVRLLHRSNLYLEKRKGRWRVIGFQGTRRRLG